MSWFSKVLYLRHVDSTFRRVYLEKFQMNILYFLLHYSTFIVITLPDVNFEWGNYITFSKSNSLGHQKQCCKINTLSLSASQITSNSNSLQSQVDVTVAS